MQLIKIDSKIGDHLRGLEFLLISIRLERTYKQACRKKKNNMP